MGSGGGLQLHTHARIQLMCCMQALDPNSEFPEKPMGSKEQQEATRESLGPEGAHQDLKVGGCCVGALHKQAQVV